MHVIEALTRAYAGAEARMRRVSESDWYQHTPCPEWNVRELANHMAAGARLVPQMRLGPVSGWEADNLGRDPLGAFQAAVSVGLSSWAQPGAVEHTVAVLDDLPLIELALVDALVHTWDLAAATGQDRELDDEVAARSLTIWRRAPLELGRQIGQFGPEIKVGPDASCSEQLVALLGRDPLWVAPQRVS